MSFTPALFATSKLTGNAMLSSRTICSRCATRVSTLAAARQRGLASFSTLTEAIEAEAAAANHEKRRRPHGQRGVGRPQRRKEPQRSAVALFNDVVKPEVDATGPTRSALDEWAIAGKMKTLEEMDAGVKDKLIHFEEEIWPQMEAFGQQMPKHLYNFTTQFLRRSYEAVIQSHDIESSVKLAQLCTKTGNWDVGYRNGLVLNLCHALISGEKPPAERTAILRTLNRMWEHISQMKRRSQLGKGPRYVLPTHVEILKSMAVTRGSGQQPETTPILSQVLAALLPQFFLEQSQKLATGLLATMAVLSEATPEALPIRMEAALLLDRLDVALQQTPIVEADVADAFGGLKSFPEAKLTEIEAYVREHWQGIPALLAKDAAWRQKLKYIRKANVPDAKGLDSFHVKLRAVYRADARNAGAVSALWLEFQSHLAKHPETLEQLRDNPDFLDFWVFVWCAVRRSNKLQETLAFMQDIGAQPTIKTYTAMMHGWKMCRDVGRIEALWEKLVESGVELDVVIWTERISALVESGRVQKGIQALADMLAQWKKAHAKNPGTTVPKPNTETVNAVFKALVSTDPAAARAVLSWAGREDIQPNVRTFNILLRESFKKNSYDEIQNILKTMQDQGIEPDAATFTILIEEALGDMHNAPAADQIQAVEHILDDIQLAGVKANAETYGKMLYAVAAMPQAEPAIAAIQAHMRSSGLAVTPHMVTILIERALSQPRPDIRAVQALLREHQLTHVRQGDQTLWERVMSAHAVTGNVDDALRVFDDLAGAGRPVSSLTYLKDLLRALLDSGRGEDASRVASTVLQNKLKATEKPDDRYWRHNFWHLAKRHGLLRPGAAVPEPEAQH